MNAWGIPEKQCDSRYERDQKRGIGDRAAVGQRVQFFRNRPVDQFIDPDEKIIDPNEPSVRARRGTGCGLMNRSHWFGIVRLHVEAFARLRLALRNRLCRLWHENSELSGVRRFGRRQSRRHRPIFHSAAASVGPPASGHSASKCFSASLSHDWWRSLRVSRKAIVPFSSIKMYIFA